MGGGWLGGGWQGGGWQGGGWQGGGWQGGADGGTYPMRTDRPLVAENMTPDGNAFPIYPLHAWDADLFALTFLPDFLHAAVTIGGGPAKVWNEHITITTPIPAVRMPGEHVNPGDDSIDDLRILAVTERPEAMGEILDQHQDQQLCFMHLLMMTRSSHPKTFFLMKVTARVGEVVMMGLKRRYKRPRPTQYYPALFPPVPVPGHASFPAGHALIAHLTARVLIEATTPAGGRSPYEQTLTKLADRIGFNRVIAGFHFRSDIAAGEEAASKTFEFLNALPAGTAPAPPDFSFASLVAAAKLEWP